MARGPQARPWGRAAIGLLARFEHKTAMLRFSTRISTVALLALAALAASVTGARAEFRLLSGDANDQPNAEFVVAADVSPSGRYVLFQAQPPVHGSAAGIDVAGLYRRDLVTGALEFVGDNSVANGGVIESSISDDGRYIAWSTSPDGSSINHIYWRDTVAGTTRHLTSGADGRSGRPLLSADGLQVAFLSEARNLVADTSKLPAAGRAAVYRWNATNQQTEVISLASTGNGLAAGVGPNSTLAAALLQWDFSRDGNWLVFTSDGTDVTPEAATSATFVWLFRRNLGTGAVDVVNRNAAGTVASANYSAPSVSDDGNRVAFVGAFLGVLGTPISTEFAATFGAEALAKDMTTGDVYWVSRTLNGANLSAKVGDTVTRTELSGDGTVVAMTAISTNLVEGDVFPEEGTNDSFDIYRVELNEDGSVATSHVNKPFDDAAVNLGLRSDGMLPTDGAYIAYATNDADVALGFTAPSTLAKTQVVGVGVFPGPLGSTTTTSTSSTTSTTLEAIVCGDANGDGAINASDALTALLTSVGLGSCPPVRCDANGDGKVLAGDALNVLRKAVGLDATLLCNAA